MSFPRYERYMPSNIPWMKEIPEGWKAQRLKTLFQLMARPIRDEDEIITAFRDGEVTLRNKRRQEGFTNALQEIGYQGVRRDDLVIHAMDAFAGAIGVSDSDGKSTPVYSVCWPLSTATKSKYYGDLLRYMARSGFINSLAKGIRERSTDFRWSDAGNVFVPIPSEQEQISIISFIEHETAKIDALIEEQRRLIELLKEKRQAVISHAVTKGLNPDAPLKSSGIEWLGTIPEGWDVLPLKRNLDFLTSGSRGWAEHYSDFGALFVRIGNLTREDITLDLSDVQRVAVPEGAEGSRTKVNAGDILFSITAFLGSVAVVPDSLEDAYVSQHVALARVRGGKLDPRWIAYTTLSLVGKTYLDMRGYGGTKIQLSLDDIANLVLMIPPVDEQRLILQWLEVELIKYESLRNQANASIRLLQERRSALISAAVTGKIDVRNYTPREAA